AARRERTGVVVERRIVPARLRVAQQQQTPCFGHRRAIVAVGSLTVTEARVRAHDGVELHVTEHGDPDARALVLLHGFPELGFSWRHQIPALVDAGYRVLVPDLRGFGLSDVPEATDAYAIDSLSADVLSLLDHAGVKRGIVIGHDWGADVAWKTAWMHPERVAAVAGLNVAL